MSTNNSSRDSSAKEASSLSIKPNDNFCPIPFLQLQLNPLGNVSACCFSGEYKVGDIHSSPIKEIWNGKTMQEWRREFITGDIKICKDPMKTFKCHRYYDHLVDSVELKEVQSKPPTRLDLRLNGKCNLECVMCDVWRQPNHLYDMSDLWTWGPKEVFPHLKEVDMLGGEPFIQKDTFRFIEEVKKVNTNVTWGFITNGQYKLTDKIIDLLKSIKLRHIHVSVDSLNDTTYAEIRKGGKLHLTLNVLNDLKTKLKSPENNFVIFASLCLQKLNFREVLIFRDFCKTNGFKPIIQDLIGLDELSVRTLPYEEMLEALQLFEQVRYDKGFEIINGVIAELKQRLASGQREHLISESI